jgi:hypothetical protein
LIIKVAAASTLPTVCNRTQTVTNKAQLMLKRLSRFLNPRKRLKISGSSNPFALSSPGAGNNRLYPAGKK